MNVLSLFSGIGGMELGLERAGMHTVGQVEIDPFCQRVLAKHWPEVSRHDDVRTATAWWRSQSRPTVDVVAGGFPCQPTSLAGPKRAQDDKRWLWPEMAHVIGELRPRWVIAENVPGLRTRGLSTVLADLGQLGYRARAGVVRACEMGAPHTRARLFVVAHANSAGCEPWRGMEPARPSSFGEGWWTSEPDVDRVAHGISDGVDRRKALGNAVVPQVAEYVGNLILSGVLTSEWGVTRVRETRKPKTERKSMHSSVKAKKVAAAEKRIATLEARVAKLTAAQDALADERKNLEWLYAAPVDGESVDLDDSEDGLLRGVQEDDEAGVTAGDLDFDELVETNAEREVPDYTNAR